jgi:cytochrome c556
LSENEHGKRLRPRHGAVSKAATWQAFQNPDYERFSQDFRRNVDALTKAARDNNLDGATLAYVKVTMSCVECHRFVRGKLVACRE